MRHNGLLASLTIVGSLALAGCEAHYYHEEHGYRPPVVVQAAVVVEQPVYVAPAPEVVTTFQTDLAPYGQWVVVANYGRCWRPTQVAATWRPYTVGHWVWTDNGWTWASEEPWGDATCHYGRWFADAQFGWVWVPGSTWAPAWVAWRSGGGYVGWAPLPPTVAVGVSVQITDLNTRDIPAAHFSFVEERRVAEPRVHEHIIQSNTTIITKTVNITNITTVNNTVVNKSLTVEHVERASGHKVERVVVREASTPAEARQMRARGEVVAYRPRPLVEAERTRVNEANRQEAARRRPESDHGKAVQAEPVKPVSPRQVENDRAKMLEAQREEAERTRAAAQQRQEAEKAHAAEADRIRATDNKRLEAEKARAADAKRIEAERVRTLEAQREQAEKIKAAEAQRAKAAELKRLEAEKAKAADLKRQEDDKIKAAEAEKARAGDLKRQEADKIKAAEAEKAKAAEARRREDADRAKREAPKPGETREQAAERAKREAEKDAAERGRKPKDDRGDNRP